MNPGTAAATGSGRPSPGLELHFFAPTGPAKLVATLLGSGPACNDSQVTDVYGSFDLTF